MNEQKRLIVSCSVQQKVKHSCSSSQVTFPQANVNIIESAQSYMQILNIVAKHDTKMIRSALWYSTGPTAYTRHKNINWP